PAKKPREDTMKITFYAHASFRLEGDGLTVITDPYTPAKAKFDPINEAADIVLMSSATDDFHSDPSHVLGNPVVVNTLHLPPQGTVVKGLAVKSYPATESLTFDYQSEYGRDPDANALYHFSLGGLRFLHMGDIGTPVPQGHLDVLKDQVDVLLALTGEHATIALDDLDDVIAQIGPRAVIPMHYFSPKGVLKIEPVETFTARLPPERVTKVGASSLTLTPEMLSPKGKPPQIYVLEQSR
ncbi:MAG: MBL fold metallo-hydrolase, partial [Alphaproteobacteria bacterium]